MISDGFRTSVFEQTNDTLPYWPSISSCRRKCSPSKSRAVLSLTARWMLDTTQTASQFFKYCIHITHSLYGYKAAKQSELARRSRQAERYCAPLLAGESSEIDCCTPVSEVVGCQQLLSASLRFSTSHRLDVPPVRLSTVGKRAFPVSGATVWNDLPLHASALSLFLFLRRHYHMTRVLLSPFITTVWTPVALAIINII